MGDQQEHSASSPPMDSLYGSLDMGMAALPSPDHLETEATDLMQLTHIPPGGEINLDDIPAAISPTDSQVSAASNSTLGQAEVEQDSLPRVSATVSGKRGAKSRKGRNRNCKPSFRGLCLACNSEKELEERFNAKKTCRFQICNACRKTHLTLISKAYDTSVTEHEKMIQSTSPVEDESAMRVARTALRDTRKRLPFLREGAATKAPGRSTRILQFYANGDLRFVLVSTACEACIPDMQSIGRDVHKSLPRVEGNGSSVRAEGFQVFGELYQFGAVTVADIQSDAFSAALKQRIASIVNSYLQENYLMDGRVQRAMAQPAMAGVVPRLEPTDIALLYSA
eukprot:m.293600 g.293600  ORF g.293600 m.293600 type:complete len:339 (-) comp26361_c0_seq1:202-1218(-)